MWKIFSLGQKYRMNFTEIEVRGKFRPIFPDINFRNLSNCIFLFMTRMGGWICKLLYL